ncbi:hypothetical protein [Streptomyces sp. SD15]
MSQFPENRPDPDAQHARAADPSTTDKMAHCSKARRGVRPPTAAIDAERAAAARWDGRPQASSW